MVRYSNIDFDHDLSNWNVSKVKSMNNMFAYCSNFDQPLDNWDVSNVEDMRFMFCGAKEFNQPLNSWNTSKVKNMRGMFGNVNFLISLWINGILLMLKICLICLLGQKDLISL